MVSNKTYNNVINTISRIGEKHDQIHTVSTGDIYDIDLAKETKFPILHINPTGVTTGDSELTYNFQIFIMDMVSEKDNWATYQQQGLTKRVDTKDNSQEVWNQTLHIATDIIGILRHSSTQSLAGVNDINAPIYFTQDQFNIEPFQEKFDNMCCGWVFQLGVRVMYDFQTCDIPLINDDGAGY
jgi:hypothetical protein